MIATEIAPETGASPLALSVSEVTGMRVLDVEGIDGQRSAGDVAASLASLLELPDNTPYALRDDATARMLVDDRPLGDQVPATGSSLVVIPKSHLGARA
jgi:hypothetical protein